MKRRAELFLSEWMTHAGRKPLVLRGARQVGKTFLIENWGRAQFNSVLKVDLERERDLHGLFSRTDPKQLLEELTLLKGQAVVPGGTLLFLDEIQACPPALAMLRYLLQGSAADGWGDIGAAWDTASSDTARHAPPDSRERQRYQLEFY
jgi:uncharacterized protein